MAFSTPEFPGATFSSLKDLEDARRLRQELQEAFLGRLVVSASVLEDGDSCLKEEDQES